MTIDLVYLLTTITLALVHINNGPPIDYADEIAKAHDLAYDRATKPHEIRNPDCTAVPPMGGYEELVEPRLGREESASSSWGFGDISKVFTRVLDRSSVPHGTMCTSKMLQRNTA